MTTLKDILLAYLKKNRTWHRKGHLYCICEEEGYSPESGGRMLRELESEGKVKVDYYKGRRGQKLAKYAISDYIPPKPMYEKVFINNEWVMRQL